MSNYDSVIFACRGEEVMKNSEFSSHRLALYKATALFANFLAITDDKWRDHTNLIGAIIKGRYGESHLQDVIEIKAGNIGPIQGHASYFAVMELVLISYLAEVIPNISNFTLTEYLMLNAVEGGDAVVKDRSLYITHPGEYIDSDKEVARGFPSMHESSLSYLVDYSRTVCRKAKNVGGEGKGTGNYDVGHFDVDLVNKIYHKTPWTFQVLATLVLRSNLRRIVKPRYADIGSSDIMHYPVSQMRNWDLATAQPYLLRHTFTHVSWSYPALQRAYKRLSEVTNFKISLDAYITRNKVKLGSVLFALYHSKPEDVLSAGSQYVKAVSIDEGIRGSSDVDSSGDGSFLAPDIQSLIFEKRTTKMPPAWIKPRGESSASAPISDDSRSYFEDENLETPEVLKNRDPFSDPLDEEATDMSDPSIVQVQI